MSMKSISRRGLLFSGLAALASGCTQSVRAFIPPSTSGPSYTIEPRFRRQRVAYSSPEPIGSIVVNTSERYLYVVEPGGMATRYGVGVGQEGLTLKGRATIGRK